MKKQQDGSEGQRVVEFGILIGMAILFLIISFKAAQAQDLGPFANGREIHSASFQQFVDLLDEHYNQVGKEKMYLLLFTTYMGGPQIEDATGNPISASRTVSFVDYDKGLNVNKPNSFLSRIAKQTAIVTFQNPPPVVPIPWINSVFIRDVTRDHGEDVARKTQLILEAREVQGTGDLKRQR